MHALKHQTLAASLVIGASLLIPVAAATTYLSENWDSYITGNDFCTINPNSGWTCVDTLAVNEDRKAWVAGNGPTDFALLITASQPSSFPPVASTAAHIYHTLTAPTVDYTVTLEFKNSMTQGGTGNFVIGKLSDVNGTKILDIGFRNANAYLDASDGSSWVETSYSAPNAYRYYGIVSHLSSKTYDIQVYNGATLEWQRTGLSMNSASDGKPTTLSLGSLDVNDAAQGFWNVVTVTST